MASETLRTRTATTVPMAGGRSVAFDVGETFDLDKTSDYFQEQWANGDPWLKNLFEGTKSSTERDKPFDRAADATAVNDQLARERPGYDMEHRQGSAVASPNLGDEYRTLPESGVDIQADLRFAAGSADTSERASELGKPEDEAGLPVSERQLGGDQAAVSEAPDAEAVAKEVLGDEPKPEDKKSGAKKDDTKSTS